MTVPTLVAEGYIGTLWDPIIEVHNEAGTLTDPEHLVVTLRKPDRTEETVTATKTGVGLYQPQIHILTPGPWVLVPQSTNPTAPGKLVFEAAAP